MNCVINAGAMDNLQNLVELLCLNLKIHRLRKSLVEFSHPCLEDLAVDQQSQKNLNRKNKRKYPHQGRINKLI